MEKELIHLEHVSKTYDGHKVLDGLDLAISENEFVTLLGPSGCGKTTTLRLIAGFETPDEGRILFEGADITQLPPNRRQVNTVFQNYALFPHMNVGQNIEAGMGKRPDRSRTESLIRQFQLEGLEKKIPGLLSGGQKQRVAIAGIMAMEPECIVLDEPTAMLDPEGRRHVLSLVKALNKEKNITILMVTHHMEEVILADRIIVMDQGKIVMDGKPKEIFSRVDEMKTLGLEVPYATELAWELKKEGVNLSDTITTKEELVEELCQFV